MIAKQPGAVASTSGASMNAVSLSRPALGRHAGRRRRRRHARRGEGCAHGEVRGRRGAQARRVASVCSGAYILAATGLLDGRAATTHWTRSNDFAQQVSAREARCRSHLREGGEILELGRHHRGHRSVARAHRRRPGRSGGAQGGAAARGLLPAAGRTVAVLDAARARTRRRTIRAAARLCAHAPARTAIGR